MPACAGDCAWSRSLRGQGRHEAPPWDRWLGLQRGGHFSATPKLTPSCSLPETALQGLLQPLPLSHGVPAARNGGGWGLQRAEVGRKPGTVRGRGEEPCYPWVLPPPPLQPHSPRNCQQPGLSRAGVWKSQERPEGGKDGGSTAAPLALACLPTTSVHVPGPRVHSGDLGVRPSQLPP